MGYRIKKRWPVLGAAIVILFGAVVFRLCFFEPDALAYNAILDTANPSRHTDADCYGGAQLRENVQKVFWKKEGLKAVLCCSKAQLLFEKESVGQNFFEKMQEVSCVMQEALFYRFPDGSKTTQPTENAIPFQLIRCIEAKTATYDYAKETLEAKEVTTRLFAVAGHALPDELPVEQPLAVGSADKVSITMVDHSLRFEAEQVKGKRRR